MGLLSQALKNFFPLNNGDSDFSSSCKIPYFNASNNPYGCVSPSKLASVLGGCEPLKKYFNITMSSGWRSFEVGPVSIVYVYWGQRTAEETLSKESIVFKVNDSVYVMKDAGIYDFDADGDMLKIKTKTSGAYGTHVLNLV